MVTGTITNVEGYETGIVVNGVVANVYGNIFVANHVPLTGGTNRLTATAVDINGMSSSATKSVNAIVSGHYISLDASTVSSIAPVLSTLQIEGSFSIPNSSVSVTGPVQPNFISSNADTYQVQMATEGIYYFTASVTGPDGSIFYDTIGVEALNPAVLDNILKIKWNAMASSLNNKDITAALKYIYLNNRAIYQQMYSAILDQLPTMFATQTGLNFISVNNNTAFYDLTTMENGTTCSYEVVFKKGLNGLWSIMDF